MKNLILKLIFVFSITWFCGANNTTEIETLNNNFIEYKIIKSDNGDSKCYGRFCWNESETRRVCTQWIEISCDYEPYPDSRREKNK